MVAAPGAGGIGQMIAPVADAPAGISPGTNNATAPCLVSLVMSGVSNEIHGDPC